MTYDVQHFAVSCQLWPVHPNDDIDNAQVMVVLAAEAEAHEKEAVEVALDEAAILAQGPLQQAREQVIKACIAAIVEFHHEDCDFGRFTPDGIGECDCATGSSIAALRALQDGAE